MNKSKFAKFSIIGPSEQVRQDENKLLSEQIKKDVDAWLAKGNEVEIIAWGVRAIL